MKREEKGMKRSRKKRGVKDRLKVCSTEQKRPESTVTDLVTEYCPISMLTISQQIVSSFSSSTRYVPENISTQDSLSVLIVGYFLSPGIWDLLHVSTISLQSLLLKIFSYY